MFDFGWSELLLIGVLALFLFGPEDIPKIMYNLGRVMRRFRYMRYALSNQFEDFMEQAERQGKVPVKQAPEQLARDNHPNDETDADEHLIDLMPPPENMPDKILTDADLDEQPEPANDDRTPDSATDRG